MRQFTRGAVRSSILTALFIVASGALYASEDFDWEAYFAKYASEEGANDEGDAGSQTSSSSSVGQDTSQQEAVTRETTSFAEPQTYEPTPTQDEPQTESFSYDMSSSEDTLPNRETQQETSSYSFDQGTSNQDTSSSFGGLNDTQYTPSSFADQEVKPQASAEEKIGIDSIDQEEPQGNWLFKRIWWERAESRFEKIRLAVEAILDARMAFFSKRVELERDVLDPFYVTIGVGQGELQEILKDLLERLERERKADGGVLHADERDFLKKIQEDKSALEQLSKDVNAVARLDGDVDTALSRLLEQINRARSYEREAWQYFKDIARVLNDKKAREMFYKMNIAWTNISEILDYIKGPFASHFEQLTQTVNSQVERIKNEIQALKERGIDFKSDATRIEEEEAMRRARAMQQHDEDEDLPLEKQQGFFSGIFSTIGSWIYSLGNGIISIIRWPYDLIFGTGKEEGPMATEEEIAYGRDESEHAEPSEIAEESAPAVVMPEAPVQAPEEQVTVQEESSERMAPEDMPDGTEGMESFDFDMQAPDEEPVQETNQQMAAESIQQENEGPVQGELKEMQEEAVLPEPSAAESNEPIEGTIEEVEDTIKQAPAENEEEITAFEES